MKYQLRSIMNGLDIFVRTFLLPLYGRKMLVFLFAVVAYLCGVQWDSFSQGVQYLTDNNLYFSDGGIYFYGIAFVFMGGQVVDRMTNKFDDVARAKEWGILKTLGVKTREIFTPQPFLVWMLSAVGFWFNIVDDEMLFYISMSYVGVNSAEALITHIRTAKTGMRNALQNLSELVGQKDPGRTDLEQVETPEQP
jgi:hypothetical protein